MVPRQAESELIVQDNAKKRTMHVQSAVILNEAKLSEFVHEEIHTWAGCTNHFRQSLLNYAEDNRRGPALFSEAGELAKAFVPAAFRCS